MTRARARVHAAATTMLVASAAALAVLVASDRAHALAEGATPSALPPWGDLDDVPLPEWASSVAAKKGDMILFDGPTRASARRGLTQSGARLPLFGVKRGGGCNGRWYQVGALAWVCSDAAELAADEPSAMGFPSGSDGLPFQYFFASQGGAYAYKRLEMAGDAAPDRELEGGWAVAIVEQRSMRGERWGRANSGGWIAMRELHPARPSSFHGEPLPTSRAPNAALDVAWVLSEKATTFAGPAPSRAVGARVRLDRVTWRDERATPMGVMARITPDDAKPAEWMLARDVARPTLSAPPTEADAARGERWIDVHLASQTLVAYEGARPVFATLVSTGRGPPKSESATPPGVHRIWVKIATSTMDNAERDDVGKHYSMEDVPWVMFFDKAVALHGAYWHQQFGRVKSHGCVNLAPLDARWLFGWTTPHVPEGWLAAYPTPLEKGTLVRVR